jgi:hypothetical protein
VVKGKSKAGTNVPQSLDIFHMLIDVQAEICGQLTKESATPAGSRDEGHGTVPEGAGAKIERRKFCA